jgi:hypothetical protein
MQKMTAIAATILCTACMTVPQTLQKKKNLVVPLAQSTVVGRIFTPHGAVGTCFPISLTQKSKKYNGKLRLLTARHVVRDYVVIRPEGKPEQKKEVLQASSIELYVAGTQVAVFKMIKVIDSNKDMDVALLEVDVPFGLTLPTLKLSKTSPYAGQKVLSFGCPAGIVPIFTSGWVCRAAPQFQKKNAWITSANVFRGASGGPLVDVATGEVVGLTSAMGISGSYPFQAITHVHIFIDASSIHKWLTSRRL